MIDIIYNQLLTTLLWSESDSEGEPLDIKFDPKNIDEPSRAMLRQLCSEFIVKAGDLLDGLDDEQLEQVGHDLWLTIAGHGAGFWDGDWSEIGDELTNILEEWIAFATAYDDGESVYVDVSFIGGQS